MIEFDKSYYNPDYSKIQVGGKSEFVDSYTAEALAEPEEGILERVQNAIVYNFKHSKYEAPSFTAMEKLILERHPDTLEDPSEANRLISPEEAFKNFDGIEVDGPVTIKKAALMARMKRDHEASAALAGKYLSWDTPLAAIAGFATLGLFSSITPTALTTGYLIGKFVPIIGHVGGVAGAGAVKFISKWKTATRLYKASKIAERSTKAINALPPGFLKAAEVVGRNLRKPKVKTFVKGAAIGGAANAAEEVILWHIEKSKGYKYDLAPAVALGVFAPAVFSGALYAVAGSAKLTSKITKAGIKKTKIIDDELVTFAEKDFGIKDNKPEIAARKIAKEVDEAASSGKKLSDMVDMIKKKAKEEQFEDAFKGDLEAIKALDEAKKIFGEEDIENFLETLSAHLLDNNKGVALEELFPFLRSVDEFKTHIKDLQADGRLPETKDITSAHLEDVFSVKAGDLNNYITKNDFMEEPPIKRNNDTETVGRSEEQNIADELDYMRTSADEIDKAMGDSGKELNEALDNYFKCITGDLADGE